MAAHLVYVYRVFWSLSETRPAAIAGVNRLALAEFNAYCLHHGIGRLEAQDIWFNVQVLDRAYTAYKSEKAAKKPA